MRSLFAVGMLALVLLPAAHAGGTTVTYVVGTHLTSPSIGIACSSVGDTDVNVGGACQVVPSDIGSVTITVTDLNGSPVGFMWIGITDAQGQTGCGSGGTGTGTVTVALRSDCTKVNVFPDLGSLAGTITVS
ncbi:MAG: hypothetical protein QOG31_21 [Thermoplasmata archaeon]|jgi:hypothetical protein|nr:hypothetical protein [Thermoplasmata archaeon]